MITDQLDIEDEVEEYPVILALTQQELEELFAPGVPDPTGVRGRVLRRAKLELAKTIEDEPGFHTDEVVTLALIYLAQERDPT